MENQEDICETEIKKNIVLVDTGGELTMPLTLLNKSCKFKEVWDKTFNNWHEKELEEERLEERRRKQRIYIAKNGEKVRKYFRDRYHNDEEYRKRVNEYTKKWREKNREKWRKIQRKGYYKNREKRLTEQKKYREENKDRINLRRKELYKEKKNGRKKDD